jgi:hypothetical protein
MLNSPQVFRLESDSSAYFLVHLLKECLVKQSVLSTNFPGQKDSESSHYDNAILSSDRIFYQMLDDTYFFSIENQCGITLALDIHANDSAGKESLHLNEVTKRFSK